MVPIWPKAARKKAPIGRLVDERESRRSEDLSTRVAHGGELSLVKALGLQDLRANQSEGVHGGCLKLAAPFPAAKACVPQGDERSKSVATATGAKVFVVYRGFVSWVTF